LEDTRLATAHRPRMDGGGPRNPDGGVFAPNCCALEALEPRLLLSVGLGLEQQLIAGPSMSHQEDLGESPAIVVEADDLQPDEFEVTVLATSVEAQISSDDCIEPEIALSIEASEDHSVAGFDAEAETTEKAAQGSTVEPATVEVNAAVSVVAVEEVSSSGTADAESVVPDETAATGNSVTAEWTEMLLAPNPPPFSLDLLASDRGEKLEPIVVEALRRWSVSPLVGERVGGGAV